MPRILLSLLFITLDARLLHAASSCGRSLIYLRLDLGTRTLLKLDLESVARAFRRHPKALIEFDLRLGPLARTNRSYYAGG